MASRPVRVGSIFRRMRWEVPRIVMNLVECWRDWEGNVPSPCNAAAAPVDAATPVEFPPGFGSPFRGSGRRNFAMASAVRLLLRAAERTLRVPLARERFACGHLRFAPVRCARFRLLRPSLPPSDTFLRTWLRLRTFGPTVQGRSCERRCGRRLRCGTVAPTRHLRRPRCLLI
jgi:hypothetical protein